MDNPNSSLVLVILSSSSFCLAISERFVKLGPLGGFFIARGSEGAIGGVVEANSGGEMIGDGKVVFKTTRLGVVGSMIPGESGGGIVAATGCRESGESGWGRVGGILVAVKL